jgi:tRNA1Val (adenine37-N6)-methyltransferase
MMTRETLFTGRLKVRQKRKGYRFSIDAPILAHHVSLQGFGVGVELGIGCGIVSLILADRFPAARIYGMEIQRELAQLAKENVRLNDMEDRVTIFEGDIKDFRSYLRPGMADVVFSNPPYRKVGSGRLSPDPERAWAKHEIKVSLSDILLAAERLLKDTGRVVLIYPAERVSDMIAQMRTSRLEAKGLRFVHPKEGGDAELVLAEGIKHGKPGLKVYPPLMVTTKDGVYSEEMKDILKGIGHP